ncbi:hypothetical protein BO83DRAFT_24356 [Aspergillus eucalypticola CBS 122712]|uniref:Transmembrane protein n=1 Tax=Aspergillus eucalypticola (strain CBS 122712 / IBT 29274) TaxID=1448314 RepID=A0A317VKI8_ASPEC|nr:uncharacterized protein BO83DRAFT_24356 [Aspergillus eucalypticola CBS 122712]PWY74039.1 hypothetical protein BO83DRAFT_24356 [Aspergillus eucalypticola CBS 122712]
MVEQQDTQAIMEGKGRVKEVRCGRRDRVMLTGCRMMNEKKGVGGRGCVVGVVSSFFFFHLLSLFFFLLPFFFRLWAWMEASKLSYFFGLSVYGGNGGGGLAGCGFGA